MRKGTQMENKNEKLAEMTKEIMERMNLRARMMVYLYAYNLVVATKRAGDPLFEKEPMPPHDVLHLRVRNLMRGATEKEAKYILAFALAKRTADKKRSEP